MRKFTVKSASKPGTHYNLEVVNNVASCDCPAGRFGNACWHKALMHDVLKAGMCEVLQPTRIEVEYLPGPKHPMGTPVRLAR